MRKHLSIVAITVYLIIKDLPQEKELKFKDSAIMLDQIIKITESHLL